MKRFIKRARQRVNKMITEEKIGFALGTIIGLFVCICVFISIDKVPATASDYEPIEKQVIAIQYNPNLLYETDCNITVNKEIITVSFTNAECKLTAQYNKNFELLSIQKEENDSYIVWWRALLYSIAIGVAVYVYSTFLLTLLIAQLEDIWQWIRKKIFS